MRFRRYKLVTAVLLIITSGIWWLWHTGYFLQLNGKLLVPMSFLSEEQLVQVNNTKTSFDERSKLGTQFAFKQFMIYSIELENGDEKVGKYFENEQYGEINFPYKRNGDFICTAKNLEKNYYVVLQIKQGEIRELMTSETRIYYPLLINNDEDIIFNAGVFSSMGKIKEIPDRYGLFIYNIKNKSVAEFCQNPISKRSTNFRLSQSGAILFFAGEYVKILHPDKTLQDVVEGLFPVWFEEDKSIIYYDIRSKSLILYDISTAKKQIIEQEIKIDSTFVLSPDKKYIAYFEWVPVQPGGDLAKFGEKQIISIVTIDGSVKRKIYDEDLTNNHLGWDNGLDWIE